VASMWWAFGECKYGISTIVFVKHVDIRAHYNIFTPSLETLPMIDFR